MRHPPEALTECKGCSGYGIKIAITYQLTASGQPLGAEGYIMQERMSGGEIAVGDMRGNVTFTPAGWHDIGPTRENGDQRVTNSHGQFTDAPVGMTGPKAFTHHATQELRAVGKDGQVINFGKNKVTVSADKVGHGKIHIVNKQMNIDTRVER